MGGHKQPAGTSLFINFLIAITACTGQKLQAIESNGVFFSGLPRPPSETNAITAKGGGDIFGNTLGRGLQEKFTTANPPKTGSTPFDFRFNSAKPDNRFVMIPASAPRTPSNFVTRPTFFTDSALTTPAPRLFVPTTAQNAVFTGRQPTPIFPIIPSSPAQRPPSSVATTRSPTPFFSIDTTPPPPGNEPSPVSPVDAGNADSLGTPCMIPERSFNAINTARPFVPVPTTTRRRIFVPASALSSGTLPTTTTLRPPTRLATVNFGTSFSTFRPGTRPPTSPAPTGTSFSFCDQRQCVKMCRERFGDRLNSSSCLANACKCEVTQTCSPSLCLEMCRKNNPGQEVLSAGCQGDNCRCSLNQPCEPSECRRRCLLAHGDKLISADCAVRNACQCVHS
ncbi:uncharacterized protein LOC119174109 isoform X6 [Rhipicephalus microplus]|uniref:uncharacterized protein LOC119174109 isoform X6 n=1 Tax=Rhipicephalus microplus TaxID=6941 RepID=UPI003F6A8A66